MKSNEELRLTSRERLSASGWFGRMLGAQILLGIATGTLMWLLWGLMHALGIQDWFDVRAGGGAAHELGRKRVRVVRVGGEHRLHAHGRAAADGDGSHPEGARLAAGERVSPPSPCPSARR